MRKLAIAAFMPFVFLTNGCGFMPGGYYYEEMHKHDPGVHGWDWGNADIDADVGHRMSYYVLRVNCQPTRQWYGDSTVVSGALPPGLEFTNSLVVEGVPRERGHWIIRLHIDNVTCNDQKFPFFTQDRELRFHVSGTGRVIE